VKPLDELSVNKEGGIRLRILVVVGTILVEALILWGISALLGWSFIDISFLGGLTVFGIMWITQMNNVQSNNLDNAIIKGMTGQEVGSLQVFNIKLTPVLVGMIIYILISGIATFVYYKEYFL
jgi:hypothetical protein